MDFGWIWIDKSPNSWISVDLDCQIPKLMDIGWIWILQIPRKSMKSMKSMRSMKSMKSIRSMKSMRSMTTMLSMKSIRSMKSMRSMRSMKLNYPLCLRQYHCRHYQYLCWAIIVPAWY